MKLTNTGSTAWTSWKLAFTFPGPQRVTSGWSANWSQTGRDVTATNMAWNGRAEPGRTVYIGFNGSGSGADPAAFTINGQSCKTG